MNQFTNCFKPVFLFVLLFVTALPVCAQQIDETYNQKIKEYTTDTRFLPASVLNLVDDPAIPSPRKHFGEIIGAPGVMHRTADIYAYYKKLADASPFLDMQQVGTTEEGRPLQLVIIGNEESMKRLDIINSNLLCWQIPAKWATRII